MKKLALRLLRDEAGFVVSTELTLVATIVIIGLITGLTTLRDQVSTELADVADAISEADQSYSFGGIVAHAGSVAGSLFNDSEDFCENNDATDQEGDTGTQCLVVNGAAASDEG